MSEAASKRSIFRWTAPKGFANLLLFLVSAFFFEFLLVYSFLSFGLIDKSVWTGVFQVPATDWFFSVSFSPLFHLLPITVLIVLVSSWVYLTKYTFSEPYRAETMRRPFPVTRRETEKQRLRVLRRFFKRVNRRLQRVGRAVKAGLMRIPGVSYVSRQRYLARASVRSALTVLLVFLSVFLLVLVVVYPNLLYQGVLALYKGNSSFLWFVRGIGDLVRGVGQALPVIGDLGSTINNVFLGAAPGFQRGLAGFGTGLTVSLVGLDVVGKYVLSQSVAAWGSALVALLYGSYVSSHPRRRVKRR